MRMAYNELLTALCALAGMLLHSLFLLRAMAGRGRPMGVREGLALLLPPICALALARGGYALLQGEEIMVRFPWCFTTGLLGLLLGDYLAAKAAGCRPAELMDAGAPGLGIAMAFARFGQRWLGETGAGPFLEEESVLNRGILVLINEWDEPVLAIFLFEALCALLAGVLTWVIFRRRSGKPGTAAAWAVCALTIPQILLEQFRTGQYLQWRMVRLEQVICAAAALGAVILLCVRLREKGGLRKWMPAALFAVMAGLNAAAQFILDGKLAAWPETAGWVLFSLSVAGMLAVSLWAALRLYNREAEETGTV